MGYRINSIICSSIKVVYDIYYENTAFELAAVDNNKMTDGVKERDEIPRSHAEYVKLVPSTQRNCPSRSLSVSPIQT